MDDLCGAGKAPAIAEIVGRLEALRGGRPSIRFAAERSPKGGQTVAAILRAAREVFMREGHSGLTLRMVAEAAGVAAGNISYYFPTKRALLEAMLREELADYVEHHIREVEAESASPLEILLNIAEFYVGNGRTSHRFIYQMWGYAGSDDGAKALVSELYRSLGRVVYQLVRAANPGLDHARIRIVVLQIVSLLEGVRLFVGIGPDDDLALATAERDVRELTRRIVEMG